MSSMNLPPMRRPEYPDDLVPSGNRSGVEPYWDDRRLVYVMDRPGRGRDPLDIGLRALAALAMLLLVALLVVILLAAISLFGVAGQVGSGFGGLGGVVERAGAGVTRVTQGLADGLDPAHPPREALVKDTEFDELTRLNVGTALGKSSDYVFTIAEIKRRDGAASADEGQYAVVKRRYETARETRVLGLVVRTDRGEAEYYLYKGESFRLGRAYYKVNWVSLDRQQVAVARYRDVDGVRAPLKLEFD